MYTLPNNYLNYSAGSRSRSGPEGAAEVGIEPLGRKKRVYVAVEFCRGFSREFYVAFSKRGEFVYSVLEVFVAWGLSASVFVVVRRHFSRPQAATLF